MEEYKAVIVGLTGIGARRPPEDPNLPVYGATPVSHASAYHRTPRVEVVGVCDLREEAIDEFKSDWSDVWPKVNGYTDFREMLEKEKPDIVSVATSDHVHADITVAAAESGARAILCEKPIATTLADADRMITAAEANNVLLSIDHSRRWYPLFLMAREAIRKGEIGPLRSIVCEHFGERAMLFRNGTHLLDMICFFAEAEPEWVVAELEPGFDHFTEYKGDGGKIPETEPSASAYIRFSKGIRAFYNGYKVKFPASQFILICEDGKLEVSDRGAQIIRGSSHLNLDYSPLLPESYMLQQKGALVAELIHVLEHGGDLVSPGCDARMTLELLLGILKSHENGNNRVNFPL